jgi:hypothetical protein
MILVLHFFISGSYIKRIVLDHKLWQRKGIYSIGDGKENESIL